MRKFMVFLAIAASALVMVAAGCSAAKAAAIDPQVPGNVPALNGQSLAGTSWVLVSFGNPAALKSVIGGTNVTLNFNAAGDEISGNGGVNGFGGEVSRTDNQITISGIMSTMMASLNQSINEQEGTYLQLLGSAQSVTFGDATLTINCAGGQELVFNAMPANTAAPIIMATPPATGTLSNTMIPASTSAPASSPTTCIATPYPVPPPTYISPPAIGTTSTIIIVTTAAPPYTITAVKPV